MAILQLQFIIDQWDKADHDLTRMHVISASLPMKSTQNIFNNQVILEQQGSDRLGNRLQLQLIDDYVLIDRFRFNLTHQTVEFKKQLIANTPADISLQLTDDWLQCQYAWRYRVKEGGYVYWLYENVLVNIAWSPVFDPERFTREPPIRRYHHLLPLPS